MPELVREDRLAQAHGAEALREIYVPPTVLFFHFQEPHVELGVMCDEQGIFCELQKTGEHLVYGRGARHIHIVDLIDPFGFPRDGAFRVHEFHKCLFLLYDAVLYAYAGNFYDLISSVRVEAGGLNVEDGEYRERGHGGPTIADLLSRANVSCARGHSLCDFLHECQDSAHTATMSAEKLTVEKVIRTLKKEYPNADCTLHWRSPLGLLVATILAAQCTDERVNIVTKDLFRKYRKPGDYLAVSQRELEKDIHSCGTYRMKAKAIRQSCRTIIRTYGGKVPRAMEEMLMLRGVGRKTAAIVLGTAYGVIEGIPIDTHNIRLLRRLGLTRKKEQGKIELDMMKKTPRKDWLTLSHLMVAHGRAICHARKPQCRQCVFAHSCHSSLVRGKEAR